MAHCKIHNVRFYNPQPLAVRCMAVHTPSKRIALARSDASIEIWNLENTWFQERSIASTTDNYSIESLAWCDKRLLSVGLHGLLVEYSLSKLCIVNRWAVTGESAFCLDVSRDTSTIAIGTENGYLNIFYVVKDEIYFKKFCDKQEGRILCLKFSPSGEFIVSGGLDAIRVWNVESGHAVHKMTTGRAEANKSTIVWCIDVTTDLTIITGDSRGKLTFWDGKLGTQIESYQSHKADILSICLNEDETSLYCAGVDPTIINYEKIIVKEGMSKWARSIQRKIHEHDVSSLVLLDNKLYSAGADSYLACSYHPPKTLLKFPPLLQNPCVHLASKNKYILLRYPTHLELWSLGKTDGVDPSVRGLLDVQEEPKKLLQLQRISKTNEEEREGIICAAISDDAKWIFYSTADGGSLFKIYYEEKTPSIIKVDNLENKEIPCIKSVFSHDCDQLITCTNEGTIHVYSLVNDTVTLTQVININDTFDCVNFMLTSHSKKYLIVSGINSNVMIWSWNIKQQQWVQHCKLPKYKYPPITMNIHPITSELVIFYSDSKIIEYSINRKQLTQFSRHLENEDWKARSYPIRNITFDPRSNHIIILQDDSSIIIINKEKMKSSSPVKNKIKKNDNTKENSKIMKDVEFNLIKKYKHLVHLEWLSKDEMVAVELNPLNILQQLPPAFVQGTFGKK